MKILHVNISDNLGGASKAAYRLHTSLVDAGIDSHFFSLHCAHATDARSHMSKTPDLVRLLSLYGSFIPNKFYCNRRNQIFSSYMLGIPYIVDEINAFEADIVHLHFVSNGMLSLKQISKIETKIVWSLHDFSPLTGGCHNVFNCSKYLSGCGNCPALNSNLDRDLSSRNWQVKKRLYTQLDNLKFVAVSEWVRQKILKSSLLQGQDVVTVGNCIGYDDISAILPKELNSRKTILFGAYNCFKDSKKGFDILFESLRDFKGNNTRLVVFGAENHGEFDFSSLPLDVEVCGLIDNEETVRELYRAADVLVVPSREETFGLTALEALSQGTPAVCFSDIGTASILSHMSDGYVVEKRHAKALLDGILWALNADNYSEISQSALTKAKLYSKQAIASKMITVYQGFLNG